MSSQNDSHSETLNPVPDEPDEGYSFTWRTHRNTNEPASVLFAWKGGPEKPIDLDVVERVAGDLLACAELAQTMVAMGPRLDDPELLTNMFTDVLRQRGSLGHREMFQLMPAASSATWTPVVVLIAPGRQEGISVDEARRTGRQMLMAVEAARYDQMVADASTTAGVSASQMETMFTYLSAMRTVADSHRTTMAKQAPPAPIPTTERLALALEATGDPRLERIIRQARDGHYDDFLSPHELPQMTLVMHLAAIGGHEDLIRRVKDGEFDATQAEGQAWATSVEGIESLGMLVKGTLKFGPKAPGGAGARRSGPKRAHNKKKRKR